MTDPDVLLALALDVAVAAGQLLLEGGQRARTTVETKSSSTDMVSEMDRAAERQIVTRITAVRPDDGILGEEGAARDGTSGLLWVIDPLDGTTNYLYGFPTWAVSVAVEDSEGALVGVVHDPNRNESFTALRGMGAFCNERPLALHGAGQLASALVGTGFSYQPSERRWQALVLAAVLPEVRDVRRAGSAALDLCWVATGRIDAYYERGLAHWDEAAGALIAREAGALTVTLEGHGHPNGIAAAARSIADPFFRLVDRAETAAAG